ncbi:MAG TPA: hypothetical protein VGK18_11675 [Propionicimonas sp.]|uniref:hypothetical protein n=1 Tax=Propionicimonas sp. TaxID=1955623 RepID=UPI002F40F5E0
MELVPDGTWRVVRRLRYSRTSRIIEGLPQFGFTVEPCHYALEFGAGWIAQLRDGVVEWTAGPEDPGLGPTHATVPFDRPRFVCADTQGNLLVTDATGVWQLDPRTLDIVLLVDAAVLGVLEPGNGLRCGNRLWLNDILGHQVWELTASGHPVRRYGDGIQGFQQGTVADDQARFGSIYDLRCGPDGTVFVLDSTNYAVRAIDPLDGRVSTICGDGVPGWSGDGGQARLARLGGNSEDAFDGPWSLVVSPAGDIFIGDTHNHAVRRISAASGQISTIAAASSWSPPRVGALEGRAAPEALFTRICGLDLGTDGRLLVPDWVTDDHDELVVLEPT